MQGRLPPTLMPVMSSVDWETRQLQLLLVMGVDDSLGGVIRLNGTLYPAFAVPSADNRHLVISALTDKGLRYAGYGCKSRCRQPHITCTRTDAVSSENP